VKMENLAAGVVLGGRFQLETILGRGSYGDVWKARVIDGSDFPPVVALKFFTNQDRALRVYLDEAERVKQFKHPHIVRVFEAGRVDGLALLCMEYVPVGTLLERLGEMEAPNPVSLEEALTWAYDIAEVLAYLHDWQPAFMHCDLKLDNLLLSPEGNVRLIDFGQSKTLDRLFVETAGVGAYPYMAPELLGSERDPRGRRYLQSDVYAFGVILYRMLTGRFPRPTLTEVHNLVPIRRPSEVNSRIPRELEDLVMRCLETKPEKRYSNGKDLLGNLQRVHQALAASAAADVTPVPVTIDMVTSPAEEIAAVAKGLLEEGKVEEALTQLNRAMQRVSTAPTMLMVYAEAAKRANRWDAARIVYQRVTAWYEKQGASDDMLRDAVEGLAEVQVRLKNYEDAVKGFAWLVDRWSDKKWYRFRHGIVLGLAGRYQASLEVLLKLQENHAGLAVLCTKVGFAYLQLKRDREAKQYFNEALMLDPHDAFALFHLARLHALKGRPDLAENYYLRLLEVDDAEDLAVELGLLLGKAANAGLEERR
jgi:tetratricopeptide (TPR) repeat protein